MLALKRLEAQRRGVATIIFDEVDAGIGGAVGDIVGRKLKQLARFHQILCVTHLAQIAAFADRHFVVEKEERRGTTRSRAAALEDADRPAEIARMLGGRRPATSSCARRANCSNARASNVTTRSDSHPCAVQQPILDRHLHYDRRAKAVARDRRARLMRGGGIAPHRRIILARAFAPDARAAPRASEEPNGSAHGQILHRRRRRDAAYAAVQPHHALDGVRGDQQGARRRGPEAAATSMA